MSEKFDASRYLIKVQGNRDYLPVAARLIWFRNEHPDWGIGTECTALDLDAGIAIFHATICDASGKQMANGTKCETRDGFPDYIEKAETGAVGRALAMCGYGTQFAPELEEGERLADAPRQKPQIGNPDAPATEAQLKLLQNLFVQRQMNKQQIADWLTEHLDIHSKAELTKGKASEAIQLLKQTPVEGPDTGQMGLGEDEDPWADE